MQAGRAFSLYGDDPSTATRAGVCLERKRPPAGSLQTHGLPPDPAYASPTVSGPSPTETRFPTPSGYPSGSSLRIWPAAALPAAVPVKWLPPFPLLRTPAPSPHYRSGSPPSCHLHNREWHGRPVGIRCRLLPSAGSRSPGYTLFPDTALPVPASCSPATERSCRSGSGRS